ncbi:MAG: hypothetical protein M4579_002791 [Chaenotheca gracillima]|nr:MAG: hypothetical protein M4579_002791 [Chaenotheca gracillima]
MAAAAVDIPYLSNYLSISQQSLSALSQEPTTELVSSVLQAVAAKARECDETKAEKLRLNVELENVVHRGESRANALKASVDKGLKEVSGLREKLKQEESTRTSLESELQHVKSSSSTSTSELEAHRSRIASLESSNRDTLALLESKSTAHDRLAEELTAQHQKTLELRREISNFEQRLQAANSASTTAKFRESNLEQEVELVRRNNEWYESELKTKGTELSKTRKEKGARIAELQRQNEDSISTIEALKRTEATLRTRLEEVGQRADDAFSKIQQLQEDAAKEQEAFRKDLENSQRLAELYEESARTARDRLQDVQNSTEQLKEESAEEIGKIQAQAETYRNERDEAERRAAELDERIQNQEAELIQSRAESIPGTPRMDMNGIGSPGREMNFSPGSSRLKGRPGFTQMYSEYTKMKSEFAIEKNRNQLLTTSMDEMIRDLESKQPEMDELRTEHERLQSEVMELTSLLDEAGKQRDQAKKESRRWQGQVEGAQRESEILRQQLRDLSTQVKVLLIEVHARDEGLDSMDSEEQMQIERFARGELSEEDLEEMSDTGRLISQRLLIFKNIQQLQEQNVNLLRITRDLGDKMEGEEAMKKQSQQAQDREELGILRGKMEKYKDEMKSMVTKSQSYIKERDMFRRMLQHRGQIPVDSDAASMFGQSINAGTPATPNSVVQSGEQLGDAADFHRTIKELTQHFDSYREEASADQRALKEQTDKLSREKGELQAEVARSNSQVTLASERLEMLQSNYSMLKNENIELQKRSHSLAESAAKQDLRTQQIAEELVEAKTMVDSMRNETANLKAEKDFWKKIEKRLSEDNENLMNERSRLNTLIAGLQNLQNERELSDSEARRKQQSQIDALESELQTTKRKLNDEVEDAKKAALRREYDHEQNQKRIEDLMASLGTVREDLVAAKTTRDHLQARVDELSIELKSAEERVTALQPRPTPRGSAPAAEETADEETAEDGISREQELAVEASELRRDLELAKAELENSKKDIEKYQEIAQSSEEELQNMNDSHDQYREEMDRALEEKDAKIKDLEQRIEDIAAELSSSNEEVSKLRSEGADSVRRVEEQRSLFEVEVARLKDEGERNATAAQFHHEDLKAQAEIAQRAQQNYESELLKHAEAAKSLQQVRSEFNQIKTEAVEFKTEAEAAQANLTQSEHSWEAAKELYERELGEMRKRREDVNAQNKLLHEQLENVTKQISALQQRHSFADEEGEEGETSGAVNDRSVANLQELIGYLRREKQIVEVQYDMTLRESHRYKQQLDQMRSQLDEARLKLDQERRAQVDSGKSSVSHRELVEKINELNLYRESTITLRNEARQAQAQLAEKSKELDALLEQIQPLRAKVQELEDVKETQAGEMKLLQEDRDRYQQRMQNILQKHDRVDPAEMESLKEQISALQDERDTLVSEKETWAPLREQVDGIPELLQKAQEEAVQPWRDQKEKLTTQFKERHRAAVNARNEKHLELQNVQREKEELDKQLVDLKQELENSKAENDNAETQLQDTTMQDANQTNSEHDKTVQELEEKLNRTESRVNEEVAKSQQLEQELDLHKTKVTELEGRINELQQQLDEANRQVEQLRAPQQQSSDSFETNESSDLDKLRDDLTKAQEEVDNLRTQASIHASISQATSDDSKSLAQQVTEQVESVRTELEARQAERIQHAEAQFQSRADRMKSQLNKKVAEVKDALRQTLESEHSAAMQQLKEEHQEAVDNINNEHAESIRRLKADEATRMEQEKQIWLAENKSASPVKAENQQLQGNVNEWQISEAQAREFVNVNTTLKSILRNNIATQVKKAREEQERTCETRLQEARTAAEEEKQQVLEQESQKLKSAAEADKEKAVTMETQRQRVKLSMADGKARTLAARVEVVQKAVEETPQKPVVEVWEVAKEAKPGPAPTQGTAPAATTQSSSDQEAGQSNPSAQAAEQAPSTPQVGTFGQPSQPVAQGSPAANANPFQAQQQQPSFGSPSPARQNQVQQQSQPPAFPQTQNTGGLPAKPPQGQHHPNAGTGPGALRGVLNQGPSGIPRGGATGGRGGRGGRGGQNQGQGQGQPQIQQPQNQSQGQPQRGGGGGASNLPRGGPRGRGGQGRGGGNQNAKGGNLNASAANFTPGGGNKRSRDDGPGEGGSEANGVKKRRNSPE